MNSRLYSYGIDGAAGARAGFLSSLPPGLCWVLSRRTPTSLIVASRHLEPAAPGLAGNRGVCIEFVCCLEMVQ